MRIGYATTFITTGVAKAMSSSSHALLRTLGKSSVPSATIAFAVDSFDTVVDFAQGKINIKELTYDLGDNAAEVAGGVAGGALVGAIAGGAAGSVAAPGAGTAAGASLGVKLAVAGASCVSSMAGCALASEMYKSGVELGSKGVEILADKAEKYATETVNQAKVIISAGKDQVSNSLDQMSDSLPLRRWRWPAKSGRI